MESNAALKQLLNLGTGSSSDRTKLASSTLKSVLSHVKLLTKNDIPLTEEALTIDTNKMLDRLTDRKGKKLSDAYKRQIGMTIRRMYPDSHIDLTRLNKARAANRHGNRFASKDFVDSVLKIRGEAVKFLKNVQFSNRIDDLGMYDTCLAIMISISTSLRINEILQLKLSHIEKIETDQQITIHSKCSNNARSVARNELLTEVFRLIKYNRIRVFENIQAKSHSVVVKQSLRYNQDYIIISSADFMTKRLKELAAAAGVHTETLGFNIFRKHVTSVLVENGGHLIAQALNSHSSVNTTIENYAVIGAQTAEKAYNELFNLIDSVVPIKPTPENATDDIDRILQTSDRTPVDLQPQDTKPQSKLSGIPPTPPATPATHRSPAYFDPTPSYTLYRSDGSSSSQDLAAATPRPRSKTPQVRFMSQDERTQQQARQTKEEAAAAATNRLTIDQMLAQFEAETYGKVNRFVDENSERDRSLLALSESTARDLNVERLAKQRARILEQKALQREKLTKRLMYTIPETTMDYEDDSN